MSNIELGTATGHIVIDSSGAQAGANIANQALASLNGVVRDNWWGLRNVGIALGGIGAAASAGLGEAATAASNWENSLQLIQTQTNDVTKSQQENQQAVAGIGKELQALALNTPTSLAGLAQIAQGAAALGLRAADIGTFTKVVDQLAHTTDATADVSTQALGRLTGALGLTQDGIKRTGDTIYELSRQTPATAAGIEQLAQRIAGTATSVGLTTPQILALSAGIASIAPNARTGAAAVNVVFKSMSDAVRGGGDTVQRFAAITGQSVDSFIHQFRTDASGALVQFLQGLGALQAKGLDLTGVLENVNIKGSQQQQILLALAQAQNQNADSGAKLSNQLQIANQAWADGNALTNAAKGLFGTTAAQMAELKNAVTEAFQAFGQSLLPVLRLVVQVLSDLVVGFANLPAPIRDALVILTAIIGAMAAFAAAIFLIGPRIILVRGAIQELAAVYASVTPAALAAAEAERIEALSNQAAAEAARAYTLSLKAERDEMLANEAATLGITTARDRARLAEANAAVAAINSSDARVRAEQAQYDVALKSAEAAGGEADAVDALAAATANADRQIALLEQAEARSVVAADEAAAAQERLARAEGEVGIAADTAARSRAASDAALARSATAQNELAVASGRTTAAAEETGTVVAASGEKAAAGLGTAGAAAGEATTAVEGLGAAGAEAGAAVEGGTLAATVGSEGLLATLGPVGAVIGGIAIVGTLAASVLGIFGAKHREAAAAAQASIAPNQQLVGILQQEGPAGDNAAKAWVVQQLAMSGALQEAQKLGIQMITLLDIVRGTASAGDLSGFTNAIKSATENGDKAAKNLGTAVHSLFNEYQASAGAAKAQAEANNEVGVAADNATGGVNNLDDALTKSKQKMDQAAQAAITLVGALLQQQSAAFAVVDAENQLQQAKEAVDRQSLDEAKASLDVQRAELDETKAASALTDANRELADARRQQAETTVEAQIAVAESDIRITETNTAVKNAQLALTQAEQGGSDQTLALEDATNKLADARLRLVDDTKTVADAQWQLNYLIQEGASGRDIQDARDTLAKSQQQQLDDTTAVKKAQSDLNKEQNNDVNPVVQAQQNLTKALLDQQKAVLDDQQAHIKLQNAQEDQANDKLYNDALSKQKDAQLNSAKAVLGVEDAHNKLQDVQEQAAIKAEALAKAQFGVEEALVHQAEANVQVQKEAALARGEEFGATQEAKALSAALGAIADTVDGPTHDAILRLKGQLDNALQSAHYDMLGGGGGGGGLSVAPIDISNVQKTNDALNSLDDNHRQHHKLTWEAIVKDFGYYTGLILEKSITWSIGAGGALARFVTDPEPRIKQGLANISGWLEEFPGTALRLLGPIEHSLGELAGRAFDNFKEGFKRGAPELYQWLSDLPGRIKGAIGDLSNLLWDTGKNAFDGFWNGMKDVWGRVHSWLNDRANDVKNVFKTVLSIFSPSQEFHQIGQYVMEGLLNGLQSGWTSVDEANKKMAQQLSTEWQMGSLATDSSLSGGNAGSNIIPITDASAGSSSSSVVNQYAGDEHHYHQVMADANDIFRQAAWTKRVRNRRRAS